MKSLTGDSWPLARDSLSPRRCRWGRGRARRGAPARRTTARSGRTCAGAGCGRSSTASSAGTCGVAQARDAAACPRGPVVLAPRRVALDDGDGAIGDVRFDADLVERVRRHALLAVMTDRG